MIKLSIDNHNNNIIELCDYIIVNDKYQNKGTGIILMQELLKFFKNTGYIKIYGVMLQNENLKRIKKIYSKNGFDIMGYEFSKDLSHI
jgi:GNAT superfamily N-acetyltransferase